LKVLAGVCRVRQSTTAKALRVWQRQVLKRKGPQGPTTSKRDWQLSFEVRKMSRAAKLKPGRLAWLAAHQALGEHVRGERAQRVLKPETIANKRGRLKSVLRDKLWLARRALGEKKLVWWVDLDRVPAVALRRFGW